MKRLVAAVIVTLAAASTAGIAASPPEAVISRTRPSVSWTGGPLTGTSLAGCVSSCDEFTLVIDVPQADWKGVEGGVAVRIDWEDPNDEFDLHVYDASGDEVATSIELHTNVEEALIYAPAPGRYHVLIDGFQVTNATYRGRAWLVRLHDRPAPSARATMRFSAPTFVDPQLWVSMPSIWAAKDGATYVAAPWSLPQASTIFWRSFDGGRTFQRSPSDLAPGVDDPRMRPCAASPGGGDTDVVTDPTGRVYFNDLYLAGVSVGVSTDRGATWRCNPVAASSPEDDRPWLAPAPAADGAGPNVDAYLAYRDFAVGGLTPYAGDLAKPVQLHLDLTTDGGTTWQPRTTYAAGAVGFTGPLFTAPDGTLYQVFQNGASVWIARSTDEGRTMEPIRVSDRYGSPANQWLGGDVDSAGNVYVAWVDQGTWDVMLSRSTDHGLHWSTPLRINPPASETAAMPWVAAGKAGDVAIAWYGTSGRTTPEGAPEGARWYAWAARSTNGTASAPRFARTRMSETPVRFGPLCVTGVGCSDGRMGDFFEIDIAPDGAIVASYADTGRIQETTDGLSPGPYVMVSRQSSGLGMTRSAPVAAEAVGDANVAEPVGQANAAESTATEVSPLDLSGPPRVDPLPGAFRISLPLASTKDLARALQSGANGLATDAYWLVLWKANDRVEYAGLHVNREGKTSFFGGDQPVGIGRPDPTAETGFVEKMASYPATFSLNGRVDTASRQIIIDVPLNMYHLRPEDLLHSMQAFSMTSLGQESERTFLQPLRVADSTASASLRLRLPAPTKAPSDARRVKPERSLPATGVGQPSLALPTVAGAAALALWLRNSARPRRRKRTPGR